MTRRRNRQAASLCRHFPAACRRWGSLLAGSAVLLLLAFVVIPLIQRLPAVREVRDAIRRREIDATALFYTESPTSAEAEAEVRAALRFPPAEGGESSPQYLPALSR